MQFAENNKEDVEIFKYKQSYMRLKDGTEIFGLYENRPNKGRMLDQLILFDDDRWLIKLEKHDFIHLIMQYFISQYSCVHKEFQILEYEDIG